MNRSIMALVSGGVRFPAGDMPVSPRQRKGTMKTLRGVAQRDPSGTLSIITLLAAPVAALLGKPEFAPVFVAVAAAILGLRTQVTPAKKADETVTFATTQAALAVARDLTDGSAGAAGDITGPAAAVVDLAVESTGRLVAARR